MTAHQRGRRIPRSAWHSPAGAGKPRTRARRAVPLPFRNCVARRRSTLPPMSPAPAWVVASETCALDIVSDVPSRQFAQRQRRGLCPEAGRAAAENLLTASLSGSTSLLDSIMERQERLCLPLRHGPSAAHEEPSRPTVIGVPDSRPRSYSHERHSRWRGALIRRTVTWAVRLSSLHAGVARHGVHSTRARNIEASAREGRHRRLHRAQHHHGATRRQDAATPVPRRFTSHQLARGHLAVASTVYRQCGRSSSRANKTVEEVCGTSAPIRWPSLSVEACLSHGGHGYCDACFTGRATRGIRELWPANKVHVEGF